MKCDHCEREATVHEVTVRNGVKIERHLCEQCATDQGIAVQPSTPITELIKHYVMAQGLMPVVPAAAQPMRATACPNCNTTFAEFKQQGLLGCEQCYTAFEGQLLPLLERAHDGGQHHTGKTPKRGAGDAPATPTTPSKPAKKPVEARVNRLQALKRDLDQAVKDERYEAAARLRDELRKLEGSEGEARS
ncbi:MAG TPA: UvrB/UvrC motif-containing protein [Phycisphaerales bacterium]|nr:UvrB/UvrC motif-containing protein [Phycisphaerales bacterium]